MKKYGKTFKEFYDAGLLRPGITIFLKSRKYYIVGHIDNFGCKMGSRSMIDDDEIVQYFHEFVPAEEWHKMNKWQEESQSAVSKADKFKKAIRSKL